MTKQKSSVILDASALLAVIFQENGAEMVARELARGVQMTTINIAETITKMLREGFTVDEVEAIHLMRIVPIAVDMVLAQRTAVMDVHTRKFGLSMGDRVCLAAAEMYGLQVLTADIAWKKLPIKSVKITLIR
jgi:PIN domain nuclease of toxin-antitoxin system